MAKVKCKKNKLKSHRGAAKRFKLKKNGNAERKSAYVRHILTKKSSNRKRKLRGLTSVSKRDLLSVKQMLPMG